MWNKPWKFAEGFVVGAVLIAAGLLLQLAAGPVAWAAFAWPVNAFVLAGFVALIVAMHLLRQVYAFRFLSTYHAAVPSMVYAVALTLVMGLTRQEAGGRWLADMLVFWPFVLMYVYMAVIVGLVVLKQGLSLSPRRWSVSRAVAMLFHLGLFVTMTTATLGNADMRRLKMLTSKGQTEWRAMDQQGGLVELPLKVELEQFIMETYDDGSPRRFASAIKVQTKSGESIATTVDVNRPVEVDGWKIYQFGYDTEAGAKSEISVLELVSDPWLPYVYAGIYMMLAGAVLMFFVGGNRKSQIAKRQ